MVTVSNLWVTEIHVANCLLKGWTLKTSPPTLLSFCMFFAWENDSVQRSYCLVLLSCLKSLRWHSWTLTFDFNTLRSCKVTLCWRKSSANFEVFKNELFFFLFVFFTHGHNFPCWLKILKIKTPKQASSVVLLLPFESPHEPPLASGGPFAPVGVFILFPSSSRQKARCSHLILLIKSFPFSQSLLPGKETRAERWLSSSFLKNFSHWSGQGLHSAVVATFDGHEDGSCGLQCT